MLDGHFFTFVCCKNCNVCLIKTKINEKEVGVGPLKKDWPWSHCQKDSFCMKINMLLTRRSDWWWSSGQSGQAFYFACWSQHCFFTVKCWLKRTKLNIKNTCPFLAKNIVLFSLKPVLTNHLNQQILGRMKQGEIIKGHSKKRKV